MNVHILVDKPINRNLLGQVTREVGDLFNKNAGVVINWTFEERDFSTYPKYEYQPGFEGMDQKWLREQCAEIYKKKAESIDSVVFLVHSDNWNLKGVWGWNLSTALSGYNVQQCRFAQRKDHTDQRNVNNSVGTLYHELHHSLDTLVFTYTGILLEKIVNVVDWDESITHGGESPWLYIRHKENAESLKVIGPTLATALKKRHDLYQKKYSTLQQIVAILEKVVVLQRELLARQRGDIAVLPNNQCIHV